MNRAGGGEGFPPELIWGIVAAALARDSPLALVGLAVAYLVYVFVSESASGK